LELGGNNLRRRDILKEKGRLCGLHGARKKGVSGASTKKSAVIQS